jgi:hypothetical protein
MMDRLLENFLSLWDRRHNSRYTTTQEKEDLIDMKKSIFPCKQENLRFFCLIMTVVAI